MAKKGFNLRLRDDQEEALDRLADADPETDRSKLIRRAIDEFLTRQAVSKDGKITSLKAAEDQESHKARRRRAGEK
jgi:predicted transcriptional regulator